MSRNGNPRSIHSGCLFQIVHNAAVEVGAAKVGITAGGQNLKDAVRDLKNGNVERAAAEVIDEVLWLTSLSRP